MSILFSKVFGVNFTVNFTALLFPLFFLFTKINTTLSFHKNKYLVLTNVFVCDMIVVPNQLNIFSKGYFYLYGIIVSFSGYTHTEFDKNANSY